MTMEHLVGVDLTRDMTRLIICPVCKDNPLMCDMKRLTIMCRSCHLDWILSKRIRIAPNGSLGLVSSSKTREIIKALLNNDKVSKE